MDKDFLLTVTDLTKIFEPNYVAIDALSFNLTSGEIVGMLGANGAGKTTLIHMLLDILSPTSGDIYYFGKSLYKHRSEILQHVGFASAYTKLPGDLLVYDILDIYARLYALSRQDRIDRIKKFLMFFDLWHMRYKPYRVLSAGQAMRVMLIKAFFHYPKVVLLDEPTASLDGASADKFRSFIVEQARQYGTAIFLTSHNMAEVAYICNRTMRLDKGRLSTETV